MKEEIVKILIKSLWDCVGDECPKCKYKEFRPKKDEFALNVCICYRMADDIEDIIKKEI